MLTQIEDDLITKLKEHFGTSVRSIESHPGRWDSETLKQIASALPGVYVVFEAGTAVDSDIDALMNGEWSLYAATAHASGQAARRRGDGKQIGAYEIIERAIPLLHNYQVAEIGVLRFAGVRNLFSFSFERQGVAVYQIRFGMKNGFDINRTQDLELFEQYHAEHKLAGESESEPPLAIDDVEIPQE